MAIKVVHGTVRDRSPGSSATTPPAAPTRSPGQSASAPVAQGTVQNEAVVTAVRKRPSPDVQRVKDYKEAKLVARDVAGRVRNADAGDTAHDLSFTPVTSGSDTSMFS